MNKPLIPLVLTGDESPDYGQIEKHTQIKMVPNWPKPELKGAGIVLSNGKIKEDKNGSNTNERGS
jgi:hypothetical protein